MAIPREILEEKFLQLLNFKSKYMKIGKGIIETNALIKRGVYFLSRRDKTEKMYHAVVFRKDTVTTPLGGPINYTAL